jgi:hypothetical protein
MCIRTKDGQIVPQVKIGFYIENPDKELRPHQKVFIEWLTKNFQNLCNVFPIFNELEELFYCYAVVNALRFYKVYLGDFENEAIVHLEMDKYSDYKFPDKFIEVQTATSKNNEYQASYTGGITFPFGIIKGSKICLDITSKQDGVIKIDELIMDKIKLPVKLSPQTRYRLRYGFHVFVDPSDKISTVLQELNIMLQQLDVNFIELYIDNKLLSCDTVIKDLNSNNKSVINLSIMLNVHLTDILVLVLLLNPDAEHFII